MSDRMTQEELQELAEKLKESTQKANALFEVLQDILSGDATYVATHNGIEIPSINKRIKDMIDTAIQNGSLEMPTGKIIKDISIIDGQLVISYKDN